jgi:DNA-binding CsgD family transcriptional regulator
MKSITPMEKKVLVLIAEGFSTHDMAEALSISRYTILSHRRSLLGKFGARNSVQLVTKAIHDKVINVFGNQNLDDQNEDFHE